MPNNKKKVGTCYVDPDNLRSSAVTDILGNMCAKVVIQGSGKAKSPSANDVKKKCPINK